jgi:hypothetical protein
MASLKNIMFYFLIGEEMPRDDHLVLEKVFGHTTEERTKQVEEHEKKTIGENKAFDKYNSERKKIEAFSSPVIPNAGINIWKNPAMKYLILKSPRR